MARRFCTSCIKNRIKMKQFNNIHISVFSYPEEDYEKIKSKLISLLPFDLGKEKIILKESKAEGFNERQIKITEAAIDKERHTNAFFENLLSKFKKEQKDLLLMQSESRLDEELNFFIRLDKEKLLNDEFYITDSGNCYHIKFNLAVFPRKRELALQMAKELFK